MAVSIGQYIFTELFVDDYEHSDRAKYVTHIVTLFCEHESREGSERHREAARVGERRLAEVVIRDFKLALPHSNAHTTAEMLAIADFTSGRIHWDDVAKSLLTE